jgi:type II secretory pathway component PulJ
MRHNYRRGFTIIEVLINSFIFTMIMMAIFTFAKNVTTTNRVLTASIEAQDEARKVLKPMIAEIRDANNASTGVFPIEVANDNTFTFYSNIDSDLLVERVRYYLNGTVLKKGVIKPSGSPLTYSSGSEAITEVIHNIANGSTPLFSYYNRNYTGTEAPLSTPATLSDVRLVKIYVIIDPLGASSPSPTTMTTQVQLRNLKDN